MLSPAENAGFGAFSVLWVATDLSTWTPKWPKRIARECQIDDVMYRRLDPEYFAWLRERMFVVNRAADAGQVAAESFGELRARFNGIQEWAVGAFGEAALLSAARQLNPELYRPPIPEPEERAGAKEPAPVRCNPEAERLARARGLVDEIREQALDLGWTVESLYFSDGYERRPFAARYGLACYIHAQGRIGEVTRQSVEILGPPPVEARSRFYNPDVEQPWIKKSGVAQ